jgi:hypothetical protein
MAGEAWVVHVDDLPSGTLPLPRTAAVSFYDKLDMKRAISKEKKKTYCSYAVL